MKLGLELNYQEANGSTALGLTSHVSSIDGAGG